MDAGPLAATATAIGTAIGSAVAAVAGKGKIASLRASVRNVEGAIRALEASLRAEIEGLRADGAELLARVDRYRKEQKEAGEGGPGSTGRYIPIDADEIRRDSGRDGRLDALEGRIRANEQRIERVDSDARAMVALVGEIRGMVSALRDRRMP